MEAASKFRFRGWFKAGSLSCLGLAIISSAQTPSPTQEQGTAPTPARQTITIPDGTAVQMRFAQRVRAVLRTANGMEMMAQRGDTVRLVVAEDVRVQNLIVICKGAIGQATVDGAWKPTPTHYGKNVQSPETDLSLRLDWIEDVTGQRIPLRVAPQGKAKPFMVDVLIQKGGTVARASSFRRDLLQSMTMTILVTWAHELNWIPAGTRITAFVHGAPTLDPAEVKQALTLLPIPDANALLTIYRPKGQKKEHTFVSCDGRQLARLGSKQHTTIELTPGKHACQLPSEPRVEISAEAGEQYFLQVRYKALPGKWELNPVSVSEGEDNVANSEAIASD